MTTTYTLPAEEITMDIIQSIKETFKGKTVDIVVSETEYLLSTPANRESLMRSIKELEEGKGITYTIEELKEKYGIE